MHDFTKELSQISVARTFGKVHSVQGLLIECIGLHHAVSVGSRCIITARNGRELASEVVGLKGEMALMMPFGGVEGIGTGCKVYVDREENSIYPHHSWVGRVINAFGMPIDDHGNLTMGEKAYSLKGVPPLAHKRQPVGGKVDVGVKAINSFLTCCKGQRMGIFAGSGVGKSMLIAMLTRFAEADVKIIGLVGERGREVQEFIHEYLGDEGRQKAVIVAATSDESALMRRQAAYTTMAIAEYFRDQGKHVLCLIDSVTRFAMAQREIGLSAGEPPTTKGYTPTVLVELPKLLERAGPGVGEGSITGLFTVLVEGDDHNEPVSDAVRGILDGHIVMERAIAERGRFPAINVLRSVSRMLPKCNNDIENEIITRARSLMATYNDMAEMIRLGAYRKGSDYKVDEAIKYNDELEKFLAQKPNEKMNLQDCYDQLATIMDFKPANIPAVAKKK